MKLKEDNEEWAGFLPGSGRGKGVALFWSEGNIVPDQERWFIPSYSLFFKG